jgi:hypothetical protein
MAKIPQGAVYQPVQKIPEGATYDTPGQQAAPADKPQAPGMFRQIWNKVNTPVADLIGNAGDTARGMVDYALSPGASAKLDAFRAAPPTLKDSESPIRYGLKQGLAGAIQDTGDTAAGFTSPLSLGTTALGAASQGAKAIGPATKLAYNFSRGAKAASSAAGAGFAGKGLYDIATADGDSPEAWQQRLGGGAMLAGGLAGSATNKDFANVPIQKAPVRAWQDISNSIMNRVLPGTPEDLLMRATKPTVGLNDYRRSLTAALPELNKQNPTSLSTLTDAADTVKANANKQFLGLRDQVTSPIDLSAAADLQDKSLPARVAFEDITGKRQQSLTDRASAYRRNVPIDQADDIRVGTNAELRGFFNKAQGDQQAALQNPETARIHAANTGVRGMPSMALFRTLLVLTRVRSRSYSAMRRTSQTRRGEETPSSVASSQFPCKMLW